MGFIALYLTDSSVVCVVQCDWTGAGQHGGPGRGVPHPDQRICAAAAVRALRRQHHAGVQGSHQLDGGVALTYID